MIKEHAKDYYYLSPPLAHFIIILTILVVFNDFIYSSYLQCSHRLNFNQYPQYKCSYGSPVGEWSGCQSTSLDPSSRIIWEEHFRNNFRRIIPGAVIRELFKRQGLFVQGNKFYASSTFIGYTVWSGKVSGKFLEDKLGW